MADVTPQLLKHFSLHCNTCGYSKVAVEFYAGFVHDSGGDVGYLTFECKTCGAKVEVDDQA